MSRLLLLKNKIPHIFLIILITILIFVLLLKEDKELIIISNDSIISVYHSDNLETFTIEILTNQPNRYQFDSDFITTIQLKNSEQELSIDIKEIVKSSESITYKEEEMYLITLIMELPFISNDLLIQMERVFCVLNYDNGSSLEFEIGEFNYLFLETFGKDLSLNNLSATHQTVNGFNTIGGISIELGNLSTNNILIKDIDILSLSTSVNKNLTMIRDECNYMSTVEECLGIDVYSFSYPQNSVLSEILVKKNNNTQIYIPLIYTEKYQFIHEFAIIITYEINDEEKTLVIDDFPYMRTSIFSNMETDQVYEYRIHD